MAVAIRGERELRARPGELLERDAQETAELLMHVDVVIRRALEHAVAECPSCRFPMRCVDYRPDVLIAFGCRLCRQKYTAAPPTLPVFSVEPLAEGQC